MKFAEIFEVFKPILNQIDNSKMIRIHYDYDDYPVKFASFTYSLEEYNGKKFNKLSNNTMAYKEGDSEYYKVDGNQLYSALKKGANNEYIFLITFFDAITGIREFLIVPKECFSKMADSLEYNYNQFHNYFFFVINKTYFHLDNNDDFKRYCLSVNNKSSYRSYKNKIIKLKEIAEWAKENGNEKRAAKYERMVKDMLKDLPEEGKLLLEVL